MSDSPRFDRKVRDSAGSVARGLDPDEEGLARLVEPGRVSTARDLHRLVLGPVGLLPPLVLPAPDQAEPSAAAGRSRRRSRAR